MRVHDFLDKTLGKAISYGVYDMINNQGWVDVGIDSITAQFATNSIRRWWYEMGQERIPKASELLITADGGGATVTVGRLWKVSLQACGQTELGLTADGLPLPAGHEQMGTRSNIGCSASSPRTGGASAVGQPRSDRESDRQHDDKQGADRERRPWTLITTRP